MKISNKQEPQQTVFNHSSNIDFQDLMSLYKICTEKAYSFLVIELLYQIILYVSKRIFYKYIKTNHKN